MKISIESPQRITMTPETDQEKADLEALWNAVLRCDEDSKVLCPIGSYVASESEAASFAIQDQ